MAEAETGRVHALPGVVQMCARGQGNRGYRDRNKDFGGRMLVWTLKWGCVRVHISMEVCMELTCVQPGVEVCACISTRGNMAPHVEEHGGFVRRPQSVCIWVMDVGAAGNRAGCA